MYTHEGSNLYLTSDDQVVEEGDLRAATLLVATGCQLPAEVAKQYGLKAKSAKDGDPDSKAKDAPQNKAKAPTQQNKAG